MISLRKILIYNSVVFGLISIFSPIAFCQKLEKTGSSGAQFLKIGIGAKAIGMGGSFVAVSDDITAMYWNPAGISRLSKKTGIVSHNNWIADSDFEYLAIVIPLSNSNTIGLSISYLSFGEIEQTTVRNPNGNGNIFSSYDMAITTTYSRMLVEDFSVGFSTKYIREQIWDLTASTVALDMGALFSPGYKPITFGVSLSNFSPDLEFKGTNLHEDVDIFDDADPVEVQVRTTPYPLPLIFRFGMAYDLYNGEEKSLTLSAEGNHLTDSEQKLNFGAEYRISDLLQLRTGYRVNDDEGNYSMGFGLEYPFTQSSFIRVDYAYYDLGRLLNSHRFSLSYKF